MTYYPPQQAPRKKKSRIWIPIVVICAVLLIGCGIIGYAVTKSGVDAVNKAANDAASSGANQNVGAGPADKPAAPVPGTVPEGRLEVGADIEPGTYKTTVPANSVGCYWSRLKSMEGGVESIIANGIQQAGAKVTVTILPADKGFESQGCGTWVKS